jgi:ACS family glucarate transporter-like MFS transporter
MYPGRPLGHRSAVRPAQSKVRYQVLAFCTSLAALTYLDRVCISVTANDMMRDFNLTQIQMGYIFSAFTLAYGLFEIPTGAWGDRIGARKVITRIVVWWSAFTMLTAGTFNYLSLLIVRFLFGAGEAGAWPNSARMISRWFPSTERGTAQGIFFMGAHFAGGVTPMLVIGMMQFMSWRWVFAIFGLVGFLWSVAWYLWIRDEPREHPKVSEEECALIETGRVADVSHSLGGVPWRRILSSRSVWGLCGMYFTQTYGFYFYITWLPTYLEKERGFSAASLGMMAGLPLLMSVAADLFGGLSTDWLSRRYGLRFGRVSVGVASLVLASACMLVGAGAEDPFLGAVCIAMASGWSSFPLGAAWGAAVDVGGPNSGVVSAFMNTAGQVGGMLSPVILAWVVSQFSDWAAPLYLTGILYFLGGLCWFLVNPTCGIAGHADEAGVHP